MRIVCADCALIRQYRNPEFSWYAQIGSHRRIGIFKGPDKLDTSPSKLAI